jgi:hypothetical protein
MSVVALDFCLTYSSFCCVNTCDQPADIPTTTIPLDRWVHEAHCFNVLRSMKTFENYIFWKTLGNWRRNVRYSIYCKKRLAMSKRLFLNYPAFCTAMLKVNSSMSEIWDQPLLDLDIGRTCELDEFHEKQRLHFGVLGNHIEKVLERTQEIVTVMINEVAASAKKLEQADPESEQSYTAKVCV